MEVQRDLEEQVQPKISNVSFQSQLAPFQLCLTQTRAEHLFLVEIEILFSESPILLPAAALDSHYLTSHCYTIAQLRFTPCFHCVNFITSSFSSSLPRSGTLWQSPTILTSQMALAIIPMVKRRPPDSFHAVTKPLVTYRVARARTPACPRMLVTMHNVRTVAGHNNRTDS